MFALGLILMLAGTALLRVALMSGGQIFGGYWLPISLLLLGGALFWCSFKDD